MKNKLFRLYMYINNIDRRHIQFAYFVVMFALMIAQMSPEDGSSGTR